MQKPGQSLPNSQGGAQQQNISINISYNLNTHKIPKSILGGKKPISKSKKVHTPVMQSIGNQFFSNMAFNPVNQGKKIVKKQNLSKKSNESSQAVKQSKPNGEKKPGLKKKKVKQTMITQPNQPASDAVIEYYNPLANNSKNFLKRNIQSPDIFKADYNRKLKTEASNYEPNESTFKKLKRSTGHMKETQSGLLGKNLKLNNFLKDTAFNFATHKVPTSISTMLKKPSIGSSKTPKARKSAHHIKQKQKRFNTQENENPPITQVPQTRHNKSCMLYSTKKQGIIAQPHLVEAAEHILSTYVSTNSQKLPRKRAQSAYSFSRNGKQLVSKLLNMSMISSELRSSQLISSERMKSGRNELTRKRLGLKVDEFDQFNHYQHNFEVSQGQANSKKFKQSHNEQVLPGNALRQYLNSIDLRIMKNIQTDTANIALPRVQKAQKASSKPRQLNNNSLSITQSIGVIQLAVQQTNPHPQVPNNNDVISFYNKLFSNALLNKRIQQEQEKYLDSANVQQSQRQSLSVDFNSNSELMKVKKETFVIEGFEDGDQGLDEQEVGGSREESKEVYEFVKASKPDGSRKLNFQHYKDLLNRQSNNGNNNNNNDKEKELSESSQENRHTQDKTFDFHLMAVETDMQFVPYSKKSVQNPNKRAHHQPISPSNQPYSQQQQQQDDLQQKAIIQLIDKSFRPSSSPSSGSSLSQMREEHVERWNHMNKMREGKTSEEGVERRGKVDMGRQFLVRGQVDNNRSLFERTIRGEVRVDNIARIFETQDIKLKENQHQGQEEESQQESALISEQRIIVNQQNTLQFSNKLTAHDHKNSTIEKQKDNTSDIPKEGKTSSRKKLSNLQPNYNEVCWQYDPDELDKQIQNYHKHDHPITINNEHHHPPTTKPLQPLTKPQNPSRHTYNHSPNNFSQDGNGSGQQQYDSKKYSQVSVYNDAVLEDNVSVVVGVGDGKGKTTFQNKRKQQGREGVGKEEQLSNSLVDSLEDGQEEEEDGMSFQEKEIGSDNRWINTNFAHHQSLSQAHHQSLSEAHHQSLSEAHHQSLSEAHHQSFSDSHGRIKKLQHKHTHKEQKQPKQLKSNQDYLDCDLSSFGVSHQQQHQQSNNQNNINKDTKTLQKPIQFQKDSTDPSTIHHVLDSLSQEKAQQVVQSHFKLTINGKQTKQKITLQVNQLSQTATTNNNDTFNSVDSSKPTQPMQNKQKPNTFIQIRRKRLTHIVQDIILQMIRQFARDISYILKKSSYQKRTHQQMEENSSPFRSYKESQQEHQLSPFSRQSREVEETVSAQNLRKQQLKKNQFVGKCFGIDTSFGSVQKYLKEFRDYLLRDEDMKRQIVKNINKDIGPNSLQILSYLRPQYDTLPNSQTQPLSPTHQQQQPCDDQDGLFVVPSQAFSQFQNHLQHQIDERNKTLQPEQQVILTQKQKRNTNFWHRGIYQSWNQFLDYERPYGINGKPYEWVKEKKKFREVRVEEVEGKLQKGVDKLLEAISLPSGIVYDKYDLPAMYTDLSEDQKMYLNEERLSRMLAIQLFESQETWINYNDEMAELLVQLGRIIEDRIFFEMTTEMKKVFRKRNLLEAGVGRVENLVSSQQQGINEEEEQGEERNDQVNEDIMDRRWLVDDNHYEQQVDEQEQEEEEED